MDTSDWVSAVISGFALVVSSIALWTSRKTFLIRAEEVARERRYVAYVLQKKKEVQFDRDLRKPETLAQTDEEREFLQRAIRDGYFFTYHTGAIFVHSKKS